jgi:hypothetical protein
MLSEPQWSKELWELFPSSNQSEANDWKVLELKRKGAISGNLSLETSV